MYRRTAVPGIRCLGGRSAVVAPATESGSPVPGLLQRGRDNSPGYRANPPCDAKSKGIFDVHDPTRASTTGNYRFNFPGSMVQGAAHTVSPSCAGHTQPASVLCISATHHLYTRVLQLQEQEQEHEQQRGRQTPAGPLGPRRSTGGPTHHHCRLAG